MARLRATYPHNTKVNLGADTFATYDGRMWELSDGTDVVVLTRGEMDRLIELTHAEWVEELDPRDVIARRIPSADVDGVLAELHASGFKIVEVDR